MKDYFIRPLHYGRQGAQVGQYLKLAGVDLPNTGYILFAG